MATARSSRGSGVTLGFDTRTCDTVYAMRIRQQPTALLLLIVCAILTACGASSRERTIKTTLIGLNAARDGFVAWDGAHQQAIVAAAPARDVGAANLAIYRDARTPVVEAITTAYRVIAIAAVLADDSASVVSMIDAAARVQQLIATLKGDAK